MRRLPLSESDTALHFRVLKAELSSEYRKVLNEYFMDRKQPLKDASDIDDPEVEKYCKR